MKYMEKSSFHYQINSQELKYLMRNMYENTNELQIMLHCLRMKKKMFVKYFSCSKVTHMSKNFENN